MGDWTGKGPKLEIGKDAMRRVWDHSAQLGWKMPYWINIAALCIIMTAVSVSCGETNIDYSHNLMGTGTVMSDFKMGSEEDTLATGRVRGSGEVTNRYAVLINDSKNISIEDQFTFHELPVAGEVILPEYPPMTGGSMSLQLLGTSWASRINLTGPQKSIHES